MSKSGKVTSWRGPFGFAEMEDGTSVYIHTDEIDGGKLRIGLTVKFDTEEVEGHNGKLKGTNVSGEAVLAKGAKLSDEDLAADRKRIEELKEATKAKQKAEFDPVWEAVEKMNRGNKVQLLKTLLKELDMGDLKKKEEKRVDPTDKSSKQTYTKGEFIAFYGKVQGAKMWKAAAKKGKGKKPRGSKKSEPQKE